jgi:hypothetical protein
MHASKPNSAIASSSVTDCARCGSRWVLQHDASDAIESSTEHDQSLAEPSRGGRETR